MLTEYTDFQCCCVAASAAITQVLPSHSQCTVFHRKSEVCDLGVGDMAKISYHDFLKVKSRSRFYHDSVLH